MGIEQIKIEGEIIMTSLINYESIKKSNNDEELFYAIICRRWDILGDLIGDRTWDKIKNITFRHTSVTLEQCLSKNMQFLKLNKKYYKKIANILGGEFNNIQSDRNTNYDTNDFYIDSNSKKYSVLDVFFDGNQPILNVKYFFKQELASRQLMKNNATVVLDEVGTGKTVSALYAIQKVIQYNKDNNNKHAKILVICPYNKREDWNNDIYRQLGRKSRIVSKGDNGKNIKLKPVNTKNPLIFIMGCIGGTGDDDKNELKVSLKQYKNNEQWDLVIIDECHNCFNNYYGIKAKRVMLLTATPIVTKSKSSNSLNLDSYKNLLESILGKVHSYQTTTISNKYIQPITIPNPTEDDIFVCNYKEDIFNVNIKRKIRFISCKRDNNRQAWFDKLRYCENGGFFSAIFADQDDLLLSKKMNQLFINSLQNYSVNSNLKLDKLVEIIEGKNNYIGYEKKSFIIFCEHIDVVDMIFDRLSSLGLSKTLVGKKHGQGCEIKNLSQNPDIIVDKLKSFIKEKQQNRAILITTGKSGGTGLNMGEFDTVVHYELPFTSNELEQRFGRIERADDLINIQQYNSGQKVVIENEMIFLINEKVKGESDFITNRMLYYSINKINKTCMYMPIRNTVLFHGDWIDRIRKEAKEFFESVLNSISNNDIEKFIIYKKEEEQVKIIISRIQKMLSKDDTEKLSRGSLQDKIDVLFNDISLNTIKDLGKEKQEKLRKFQQEDNSKNIEFEKGLDEILEYYIWLRNTFALWGNELFDSDKKVEDILLDDMGEDNILLDDSLNLNNDEINQDNSKQENEIMNSIKLIKSQIINKTKTINDLCKEIISYANKSPHSQEAAGIFYIKDNKFINQSVEEFRKNNRV